MAWTWISLSERAEKNAREDVCETPPLEGVIGIAEH
jgi:hypothetical protein